MSTVRLKRLLGRGKVMRKIADIFAQTSSFGIYNAKDICIYGEVSEGTERCDLVRNEETIGYILGSNIAQLSLAVQEVLDLELNKRELASEVLDRYRELNLLYELAAVAGDV